MHADFISAIDVRLKVDIRTDIYLLELSSRVRDRTRRGHGGIQRARNVWNFFADLQGGLAAIGRTQLRPLYDVILRIAQKCLNDGAGKRNRVVGRGESMQIAYRDLSRRCACS